MRRSIVLLSYATLARGCCSRAKRRKRLAFRSASHRSPENWNGIRQKDEVQ